MLTFHQYFYLIVGRDGLVGGDRGKEGVADLTTLLADGVALDGVLTQT